MDRTELARLLALKHAPAGEVQQRDPELWASIVSGQSVTAGAEPWSPPDPAYADRPLASIPEVALQIEKARVLAVAEIAGLKDRKAERLAAEVSGVSGLGNGELSGLVEGGTVSAKEAEKLRFAAALYQLTDENTGLAATVAQTRMAHLGNRAPASTRDLAALKTSDWEAILASAKDPRPEGVGRQQAAAVLAQRFAALFPDLAFVSRLPRADTAAVASDLRKLKPLLKKNPQALARKPGELDTAGVPSKQLADATAAHERLHLLARSYPGLRLDEVLGAAGQDPREIAATIARRVSLVDGVWENLGRGALLSLDYSPGSPDLDQLGLEALGATAEEQTLVLGTLKAYQRSYALTRTVDDAHRLLESGFTSAGEIALLPFSDFQAAVGLDAVRARRYWSDARSTFLDSTLLLGSILDVRWGLFDELGIGNVRPAVHDYLRRLDGYGSLFGEVSFCSCRHCQSILGQAAYFVDLMKFVDDQIRPQFRSRPDHPLDLRTRRPDLWTLDLSCACKDERIPTLDLVNEILENHVARGRGYTGPLTDRAAVSRVVYEQALLDTVHSFAQPFHLPLARVDAYLAKLESSRAAVVRALRAGEGALAAAVLGLSPQQWRLISRRELEPGRLGRLYGTPFTPSGSGLAPVEVEALLSRTGLSREELGQVVGTAFVRAGGASVSIRAERRGTDSVQNDVERVRGLTADALDRMHRFARLRKKLPWSIGELDRVLAALGDRSLEEGPVRVARVRDVQSRFGISVDEACALVGELPRTPAGASLFDRLFDPPAGAGAGAAFPGDTTPLVHPAFRTSPSATADPALPRLQAALNLDLDGLGRLVRRLAPHLSTVAGAPLDPAARNEADRNFALSAANLTLLYRHARLARLLGLSIAELFQLVGFAELPGRVRHLEDLLRLLDVHDGWRQSGYTLDETAVATRGQPLDSAPFPDPAALAAEVLSGARDAPGFNDTVFAVALGTTEQASRDLIGANRRLFTAAGAGRWRLADNLDLASAAITVPTNVTAPVPPSGSRAVTADEVRAALGAFLPQEVLLRRLAAALGMPTEKVRALAALAGRSLTAPELAAALRPGGDPTPLRDLIAALRPYAVAFRAPAWDAAALEMVRQRPGLFALPASGPTVLSLRALAVYPRHARRRTGPAPEAPLVDPADVRAALQAFDTAAAAFTGAVDAPLARVLQVSPGLVLGLRGRIRPAAAPALTLDALADAALLAGSLGVDGETLAAIAGDDSAALTRAASALAATYGARFQNAAEHREKLAALDEPLREAKRDALVAYLTSSLPTHPFTRPDDLYAYFLVDVQAGGCSTTSCIAAATSSVQLYVHRVLMNLEQDRRDPADPQHLRATMRPEAAAEWSWRKNYRVWEANRKIFLWPENYLEPDLRDDKTPLFRELESALLQTDITDQNVLDAYTRYLKEFEEIASLTIAGAYHDVRTAGEHTTDILHLFGATSGDPPVYYYRTGEGLIASGRDPQRAAVWSPWRKIDVQISGRRVSPVVYQGRLHLFWAEYRTRPLNQVRDGNSDFVGYQHTLGVKFCTLRPDGTWTPPQGVELPDTLWFGPGRGVIRDLLRDGTPRLDRRAHREPIDDYTLSGPGWEWLWLEPGRSYGQEALSVRYRNFLAAGSVDLFARRITPEFAEIIPDPQPQVLTAHGGELFYGSPPGWLWGPAGMANLLLETERFSHPELAPGSVGRVEAGLRAGRVATLRPGTRLLALPGSVEDVLAQVGPDVVLLQGSVTDDSGYVVRRIGTTLAAEVSRRLFVGGVDGLLDLSTQRALREAGLPLTPVGEDLIDRSNQGTLDFRGPYGVYYREIFFHVPFLIATALNSRGRFAAAQRWFHYVFDPTATEEGVAPPGTPPEERARRLLDRVWRYSEFRSLDVARLREVLTDENALAVYRRDPFNPHAIARLRLSAYQKAAVMKYVDNLLDWADQLFTQFSLESVNEALMLYTMAADVLGPRPARLGDCGEGAVQPRSYERIAPTLGRGGEILMELESLAIGKRASGRARTPGNEKVLEPGTPGIGHARQRYLFQEDPAAKEEASTAKSFPAHVDEASRTGAATQGGTAPEPEDGPFRAFEWQETRIGSWGPPLGAAAIQDGGSRLGRIGEHAGRLPATEWIGSFGWSLLRQVGPVFCVPANQELLAYWDRVEDRLYKIRHCMDIHGQQRELALVAPEIDPRLLARMRAAGLTLEDVLGSTSGSLPPYRFLFLLDRAKAFAASLSGFGAGLLAALEKKDGEEMNRLRLVHQQNLARLTTRLRDWDIEVARESLAALEKQREAAEYRRDFYQGMLGRDRNDWEVAQSVARHTASGVYITEGILQLLGGVTALIPQLGSPFAMKYGGVEISGSLGRFANSINATAKVAEAIAASAGLEAGFDRRREGWGQQKQLAELDIAALAKQLAAARIRVEIAERSLRLHEEGLAQLDEMLALTESKFTSLGRYTWLSGRLRRLYRDAYQNALALARLAEQAFRFERGEDTSPGLSASHWDAAQGGLLAGEQLLADLQNLERRFLETNYRSLEVDQAFALSQVAPQALLELRENGDCRFTVPELFFDLYYPGHYKRRIKSVRLTIPSITGPYVNVSATLTLERSWIRPTPTAGQALVDVPPRRSVSVATSTAQNDAGVFELSFRDERYMPFENAGAVSGWRLSLPRTFRQFDYQTITDVILSISYTAEHDHDLRDRVESDNADTVDSILQYLSGNRLARVFSLRQDFSSAFTRLLHASVGTAVSITIDDRFFPAFLRGRSLTVERALVLVRTSIPAGPAGFRLLVDGAGVERFTRAGRPGGLPGQELPAAFSTRLRGAHTLAVGAVGDLAPDVPAPGDPSPIDPEKLLDILVYVEYRLG